MKVFIVEDDFVVRQGIQCSLEWEEHGLSICGDAANGKQGLELVEKLEPDIIITDIRMPIMDGLEFAERVLDKNPNAKIIILSGYDDFAYAKQAIHLGIYDYLLKPIDGDELLKCVCKLRDEILEEQKRRKYHENQDILVKSNQTELYDSAMEKLMRYGFLEQKEQVLQELAAVGVNLIDKTYKVLLLVLENFLLLTRNHSAKEQRQLIDMVKSIASQVFAGGCQTYCFVNSNHHFVILLEYEVVSKLYLEDCYLRLIDRITKEAGFLCSIACGLEKHSIEEIYLSYQESVQALRCHASQIENNVFQYTGESILDGADFMEIREEEKQLLNDIQKYDTDGIQAYINAIFEKAVAEQEPYEKVNSTCVRLVTQVFSVLDEMGIKFQNSTYSYKDTLLAVQQYHSIKNLKKFVEAFMQAVAECLEKAEKKKYSSVVEQAVNYVKENYMEEISVKSISAELYITPNYFSQIFKSQLGMNFIDYLNEIRIEHAKKLLKNHKLKIYEVAEQSGYQNYKYFNTVFKKYTGYSPKEYRNGAI